MQNLISDSDLAARYSATLAKVAEIVTEGEQMLEGYKLRKGVDWHSPARYNPIAQTLKAKWPAITAPHIGYMYWAYEQSGGDRRAMVALTKQSLAKPKHKKGRTGTRKHNIKFYLEVLQFISSTDATTWNKVFKATMDTA